MALRFKHRILEHLAHSGYEPAPQKDIARRLHVEADDRDAFQEALDTLVADGHLEIGRDRRLRLPSYPDELTGIFRQNPRGFGFVVSDQPYREGDLFIPRGRNRDAISGDRVRVEVLHQEWRGRSRDGRSPYTGRVLEVVERGQDNFVGVLTRRGGHFMVVPDGRSLHDPVVIHDPHAKNAKLGDKVVIELLHYPEDDYLPEGVITRVLGEAGRPDVETQAVIEAHGLRQEFPHEVIEAARRASKRLEDELGDEIARREDLRETFVFTIDPPDAKDFDDAISIARDGDSGQWTLGVHIADVAQYVRSGEALDVEAHMRGNSVYLPRLVIPMLPEVLSNGVCSLQEGVDRLTKSVFITFDDRGNVVHQRVAGTVIKSAKRLTYLEAQALIDGDIKAARQHARTEPVYSDDLTDVLRSANTLAQILRKRRMRDGMIVLNLPEVELVFDDAGHVRDAVPEDDAFTHTIIEMFMVEANEALARLFDSLLVPILRRIHPDPVHGDLTELRMYARAAQYNLPENPTRHDLQRLLAHTDESPAGRAIHFAVLRTLTKASYSPALIGHFALASQHYAHFTSPIRRYPDLTLHRALEALLEMTDNGSSMPGGRQRDKLGKQLLQDERVLDEGELIEAGRHCSDTEAEAEAAERELRDFLVMQFLKEHHLGEEFTGVVTGVMSSGVFVSIERFLVEGRIASRDLPTSGGRADRWDTDQISGRLVAQRSGASLGIGDVVTVRIEAVDLASRHLDLTITKMPQRRLETTKTHPGERRSQKMRGKQRRR